MADINILYDRRSSITGQLARVRFELQSTPTTATAQRQALEAQEAQLAAELIQINQQISLAQQAAAAPRQSAGETVREAQTARAEGASGTNPPPPPLVIQIDGVARPQENDAVTNAQQTPTSGVPGVAQDRGLNDPVRRQGQTQATPSTLPAPGAPPPNTQTTVAAQNAGVAAAGDDVRASINVLFGGEQGRIITQDNVLDKYANYTYSISIYLMSPQDYARLIRTQQKNLAGYNLLIQSAGIPVSTGFGSQPGVADVGEVPGVTTFSLDAGRNQYFQEDFYIDDVRMQSVMSGKGTAGPHNVTSLDFKITEPNGITFLPRLYKAVQQYVAGSAGTGDQNYAAQNYLMVIRFYGYDQVGNQYVPIKGSRLLADGSRTTEQAIEKFIPFQFTSIKFRVADRITEYQCEAVCPQNLIATGPARGVIPYNVEITSKTLQELFNGPVAFSSSSRAGAATPTDPGEVPGVTVANRTATDPGEIPGVTVFPTAPGAATAAPPKASSASTPTITQGLAQALNQYQEDLVQQGTYTVPDTYRIEILTPALQNARVVPPCETNQRLTPMGPGAKAPANQQKNPATQSQNKEAKNTSAFAGMSIMQFIDQYTRTSTYIYDQQTKVRDPNTQKERENGTPAEVTAWYRVGIQTVPKTTAGYDPKRNDYAYDITYQLSPYKVNDLQSDYFPQARFQGTHKKYNYWFTGENTQILKFEQDFNYLYYLTINSSSTQSVQPATQTTDYREYLKRSFSPRSAQSAMGAQGPTNEPSANAADYLYSPADQGRISLEIVGDPAWLQQGELWAGVAGAGQLYGPFLDDGTINFEGQEVIFEIAFNMPVDYNLDTGVMDVTTNNYGRTDTAAGSARQSYIYRAIDVVSKFSGGRFTQELNGVLILFDLPQQDRDQVDANQRDVSALPNETEAETRRLQRQAGSGTFAERQQQAAGVMAQARRDQVNQLVTNPIGAVTGTASSTNPLTPDSLAAEGVIAPAAPSTAPTSGGQIIGPASTPTSIFGQYGATGEGAGIPAVTFTTATGRPLTFTSAQDVTAAFNAGFINRVVANELTRQLNIIQQQANAPVNNRTPQDTVREP
jgi:hypothetical protein